MANPPYYNPWNRAVAEALESLYDVFRTQKELEESDPTNRRRHAELYKAMLDRQQELIVLMGKVDRARQWHQVNEDVAADAEDALVAADEKRLALKGKISQLAELQLNRKGFVQPTPDYRALQHRTNSVRL